LWLLRQSSPTRTPRGPIRSNLSRAGAGEPEYGLRLGIPDEPADQIAFPDPLQLDLIFNASGPQIALPCVHDRDDF